MTSLIRVSNLTLNFKTYRNKSTSFKEFVASGFSDLFSKNNNTEFQAIKNLSLEIKSGERVGIIGANGAGKSTLLKAICGIYEPSKGEIKVIGRLAPLLEIGAGFHPEFTGRENLYLNAAILGYSIDEIRKFESEIISFAELEKFIDTPVKYYSTGMYLRLAFSIATAKSPDILILDELFAGGDASFVQKATLRMQSIIDASNIMVMVSHDLGLLTSFCKRIIWVENGEIAADGNSEDVIRDYLMQG